MFPSYHHHMCVLRVFIDACFLRDASSFDEIFIMHSYKYICCKFHLIVAQKRLWTLWKASLRRSKYLLKIWKMFFFFWYTEILYNYIYKYLHAYICTNLKKYFDVFFSRMFVILDHPWDSIFDLQKNANLSFFP